MAQFKRFSGSESESYNSSYVGREGELTWDPDNGLRIHDGNQNGGQQIGITSYQSLNDKPTNLASIQSGNGTNNRQFLRYNSSTYEMEYANDFRIVPFADVDFPGGTLDVDKAGDVAFDQDAIYYCYQQPNAYSIAYGGSTGWSPEGWLRINGIGPNNKIPQVGDSLTDGTTTSTIASVEAPWQDQGGGATFMLINISPAVSSWKNGSGNLTVYTGVAPVSDCWVKFSKSYNDLTNKPTIPTSLSQLTNDTDFLGTIPTSSTGVGTITWADNTLSYSGPVDLNEFTDTDHLLGKGSFAGWHITDDNEPASQQLAAGQAGYAVQMNSNVSLPEAASVPAGATFTFVTNIAGNDGSYTVSAIGDDFIYLLPLLNGSSITVNTGETLVIASRGPETTEWDVIGGTALTKYQPFLAAPSGGIKFADNTVQTTAATGGSSSSGFETKNANFTAEACKTYWLDSGTSAKTVTLPASPTAGDWVKIYDGSLNWTTYNLTVNGNGNNIRTVDMGAGQVWGTPASTSTLNQAAISPTGPLGATFVWNGTYWHGAA